MPASTSYRKDAKWVGGQRKFQDASYKIPVNGRYFLGFFPFPSVEKRGFFPFPSVQKTDLLTRIHQTLEKSTINWNQVSDV